MTFKFVTKLLSTARSCASDRSGNFGVIAAIGMTAMTVAVGAGLDLSGASSEKSRLQDISDSAVLAAAASGEKTKEKIDIIVDDMMAAHAGELQDLTYSVTLDADNITVTANAIYETYVMAMFGYKKVQLKATSGSPTPHSRPAHVSLVLDTTDSMEGANLSSLQEATKDLIEIIETNKAGGAKMAIVPFGEYVNVGLDNRNADWMDVPADSTETPACYMTRPIISETGCTTVIKTRYRDGVPEEYEDTEGCVYEYAEEEVEFCPLPNDIVWRGCAGSRNAPLNIVPSANRSTKIPAAMQVGCGSEMLALTDDFGDIEDTVDNLRTRGNTYIPTGLLWGWRSLTSSAPFEVAEPADEITRALILMTDGGNTMSQYDRYNDGDFTYHQRLTPDETNELQKAADRMLALCDGIKNDGITIFTVGYKMPSGAQGTQADLGACASSSATSFSADNTKELKQAFRDIGNSLGSVVRLSF